MTTQSLRLSGTRPASPPSTGDAGVSRAGAASGFLAGVAERELVRRAQEGAVEAFGALVERYEPRVMALLRFRLRPEVDAEDVAQDAFIRAWTRLDQFDSGRDLAPWLLTIAARTAVAHNRKARSQRGLMENASRLGGAGGSPAHGSKDGDHAGGARSGLHTEDRRVWDLARGCLSEETVTALWLRYGEDMSMRQIGAVLGWSEIHVRVALSRARKRLRGVLDGAGVTNPNRRSNDGREADHE